MVVSFLPGHRQQRIDHQHHKDTNLDKDNGFEEIFASVSDYKSQSHHLSGKEEQNLSRCYF